MSPPSPLQKRTNSPVVSPFDPFSFLSRQVAVGGGTEGALKPSLLDASPETQETNGAKSSLVSHDRPPPTTSSSCTTAISPSYTSLPQQQHYHLKGTHPSSPSSSAATANITPSFSFAIDSSGRASLSSLFSSTAQYPPFPVSISSLSLGNLPTSISSLPSKPSSFFAPPTRFGQPAPVASTKLATWTNLRELQVGEGGERETWAPKVARRELRSSPNKVRDEEGEGEGSADPSTTLLTYEEEGEMATKGERGGARASGMVGFATLEEGEEDLVDEDRLFDTANLGLTTGYHYSSTRQRSQTAQEQGQLDLDVEFEIKVDEEGDVDEDRLLLSQYTMVSPSPKRIRKRARTVGKAVEPSAAGGSGSAETKEEEETSILVAASSTALEPAFPFSTSSSSSSSSIFPSFPASLQHSFSAPSALGLSLSFESYKTPLRPAGPARHASISTATGGLPLEAEGEGEDEGGEDQLALSSHGSTVESAVLSATTSMATSFAPAGPSADLASLAASLASHLSKEGAASSLPTTTLEQLRHALSLDDTDIVQPSQQDAEDLPVDAEEDDSFEMPPPPPFITASRLARSRTGSCSSLRSVPAASPASQSQSQSQHARTSSSSSITAAATSLTGLSSLSSLMSSTTSPSISTPSQTSTSARDPPVPYHPHPSYPSCFSRPLKFVYETGLETYEQQREVRTETRAMGTFEGGGVSPRVTAGGGGGGGKKRKGRGRGRSVSWAGLVEEEEKEEENEEVGAKGARGGSQAAGEDEDEEEGMRETEYVPRPTRSRGRKGSQAGAGANAKGKGKAVTGGAGQKKALLRDIEVEPEVEETGEESAGGGVRRSKRARNESK
ncbi:hypothetical protein JCM11641_006487 [Rhodosporidiobolus odoratus]